jgi:hypothetical protein
MEKKLKQAIALIESAMADIKQSEIIHENMAVNMFRRQLKGAVECILSGLEWKPSVTESTKVNSVKASRFLSWHFSDSDEIKSLGVRAFESLTEDGEFTITAQDLFVECGYIPQFICVDTGDDDDVEYDPSQIQLINDL